MKPAMLRLYVASMLILRARPLASTSRTTCKEATLSQASMCSRLGHELACFCAGIWHVWGPVSFLAYMEGLDDRSQAPMNGPGTGPIRLFLRGDSSSSRGMSQHVCKNGVDAGWVT